MNTKYTEKVLSLLLVLCVLSLQILALSFVIRDPKSAGASSLSASPPSGSPAPVETPINVPLAAIRELDYGDNFCRIAVYLLPSGERLCVVNLYSSPLSVVRLADAPEQFGAKDALRRSDPVSAPASVPAPVPAPAPDTSP